MTTAALVDRELVVDLDSDGRAGTLRLNYTSDDENENTCKKAILHLSSS
jgi:hypothetical protein